MNIAKLAEALRLAAEALEDQTAATVASTFAEPAGNVTQLFQPAAQPTQPAAQPAAQGMDFTTQPAQQPAQQPPVTLDDLRNILQQVNQRFGPDPIVNPQTGLLVRFGVQQLSAIPPDRYVEAYQMAQRLLAGGAA